MRTGTRRAVVYGGKRPDWWLASGTIALANVLEYVENPAARQLYAGAEAASAWSVSFRTSMESIPNSTIFPFDAQSGRLIVGLDYYASVLSNGVFVGAWNNLGLFAIGDHSYMIVSDGSNIQCYRDNGAVGSAIVSNINIGGTTRWRSRYVDLTGNWYDWPVALRAGHVANVALDATQRAALHTAMMALA